MLWIDYINIITGLGTAIGVGVAAYQLIESKRQSQIQFEDTLSREYREIIERLPVAAFFGTPTISSTEIERDLRIYYRYFDLCNEQIFLRYRKRISGNTWNDWRGGIRSNLQRPTLGAAWELVKNHTDDFAELRRLEKEQYHSDPADWMEIHDPMFESASVVF